MVKKGLNIIGCKFESTKEIELILEKIGSYRKEHNTFLQIFNPDFVIGKEHLLWAYDKAKRSFEHKTNRADSLEIEILLWASGERQIKNAIKTIGIKENSKKFALLIDSDLNDFLHVMECKRDDTVLDPSINKLKNFGISENEIDSVENPYDLIFEKLSTSIL
ncbi:MAG: KEOPS complex subunit Cgi121 [Candidatus Saliniplasma sp.]